MEPRHSCRGPYWMASPEGVAPSTCRLEAGGSSPELRGCENWSLRQELHPHWLRSERSASAVGLRRGRH
jgi:hypothetical protein